ncbi:Cold-shock DNA-binding domain family protein [Leishmania donovani]|uniref:Cold-shock DNA-binding domain family protein n=1 Tax=Leishmania donovani TaxID=5661 RepID=A0A504XYK2_LEIDO|nr:Cold-shock DNA-binding domain family protein [Leishmania donovani]TPP54232.1 Cold-shock DNA-binding domain family protein [Leishmania donovani]
MFRASSVSRIAPSLALLNTGKVVSWMSGRGFGFIEDNADKRQHFVHFSALQTETGGYRALAVDQEVEFEVASQDGRTRAENVTAPGGGKLPSGPRPPEDRGGDRDGGRQNDNNFSDEF